MNNEGYCNTEFIINSLGNYTPEDSDWNYKDVPHLNIVHKNVEGLLAIVDDNCGFYKFSQNSLYWNSFTFNFC